MHWQLTLSFFSLASPEQVFFFRFNESSEVHWLQLPSGKQLLQNWGRRGRQRGGRREEIFFSPPPPPPPLVPFLYFDPSISPLESFFVQDGRRRLVSWFALQNTAAGYHLLPSNCFHKNKGFLFTLSWTHTLRNNQIFPWPGIVFNIIIIVDKFLLLDGKSKAFYKHGATWTDTAWVDIWKWFPFFLVKCLYHDQVTVSIYWNIDSTTNIGIAIEEVLVWLLLSGRGVGALFLEFTCGLNFSSVNLYW